MHSLRSRCIATALAACFLMTAPLARGDVGFVVQIQAAPGSLPPLELVSDMCTAKSVLEQLQLSGRAFVSSTVLAGRFVLRACFVNPLSSQADVDAMLAAIKELAEGNAPQA